MQAAQLEHDAPTRLKMDFTEMERDFCRRKVSLSRLSDWLVMSAACDTLPGWWGSHLWRPAASATRISNAERMFDDLKTRWLEEVGGQSSLTKIVGSRHYLRIISMGESALPFILRELEEENPAPWFAALRAITGRDDIGRSTPGQFRQMADEWIEWGKSEGWI